MTIQIGKNDLLNGLKINEMTGSCKSLPVTDNYLININGTSMTVVSTDLENDIIVNFDINPQLEESTFLVNRKKLYSAVTNIRNGILELIVTDDLISIKSGVSVIKLPINTTNEEIISFPTIDFHANTPTYEVPKLSELMRIATSYVGNDEMRPVMKAMNLVVKNGVAFIAAIDTHKLYCEKFNMSMPDININIPNSKIIKYGFTEIGFIEDRTRSNEVTHVIYQNDNFIYRSRLIDGRFPNYEAIIPKNNDKIVNLDKTALIASLNELKTTYTSTLVLAFKDNKIILTTEDLEGGASTLSLVNTNESNIEKQFALGCNLNFLQTCLSHLDNDIMLNMSEPNRPIVFSDKNEDRTILLMPVLIETENVFFEEWYNEILGDVKQQIKIKSETIVEENINLDELEVVVVNEKKKTTKKVKEEIVPEEEVEPIVESKEDDVDFERLEDHFPDDGNDDDIDI